MTFAPSAGAALPRDDLVVDRGSFGGPCSDSRPLEQVSAALPLCSLDAAVKRAPADSTVLVREGTYPELLVDGDQGRGAPVTFRPAPGDRPVIQGIRTEDAAELRFDGFRITGQVIFYNSHDIHLVGNDISPRGVSVRPGSSDVRIERNHIHDLVHLPNQFNGGYGVLLQGGGGPLRNVTVKDNRINRIPMDGIQVTSVERLLIEGNEISEVEREAGSGAHSDAIQILGGEGVTIRSNLIHNAGHGLITTDVTVTGLAVVNNVFAHFNRGYATQLGESPGATMINNTYWDSNYGVILRRNATDLTIKNNIFEKLTTSRSRLKYEDHNLVVAGDSYGAHDIRARPEFVNPRRLDFRLRQGSPGIDRGERSGAPGADLFGRARVGRPDLGAVEFLGDRGFGLKLRGRRTQRFRTRRGVFLRLRSPVKCTVKLGGRVRLRGGGSVRLRQRRLSLSPGETVAVVLRPKGGRAGRRIRRTLREHGAVKARVQAVGTDRAGDSQRGVRAIRLRR